MNKPTKTPYNEMPDKVRLLVQYCNMVEGQQLIKYGDCYRELESRLVWSHLTVDLLLQAGWAEPVVKKTRLARVKKWEKYWYIDYEGKVANTSEDHASFHNKMYELGNYFHTEAQAERASKAMHEKLMELQKEFAEEENCI